MGLIEMFTVYLWNWLVYTTASGSLLSAWQIGLWGLFWGDDDGMLTNEILKLNGGNAVEFPVDYEGMSEM